LNTFKEAERWLVSNPILAATRQVIEMIQQILNWSAPYPVTDESILRAVREDASRVAQPQEMRLI
jgi:hypothetical protein